MTKQTSTRDQVFQLILKNLIMGVSVLRMFRLLRALPAVKVFGHRLPETMPVHSLRDGQ